eukprot:TRINITY_DN91_c0_g2_i2.p1 TRINITY_DN91_c0_g2~~TRINITY_DN91_c0_g2_i2.p1  ORF type:complete len:307 (+),score=130.75 TRINITY_DN91_c0_g2_i2:106-921(+)
MVKGTVKAWHGRHGFVKLDDGRLCYVHQSDIKLGGALKQGLAVSVGFVQEVEGHKGRVKGSAVSGAGVISKEEYDAEVKAYHASDEYKQKRAEAKQAKKEKLSLQQAKGGKAQTAAGLSLEAKKRLIAQLQREVQSGGGSDRRRDPTDPASTKTYTKQDFIDFHGQQEGARLWGLAARAAPPPTQQPAAGTGKKKNRKKKKSAGGAGGDGPPVPVASAERRRDPTDPTSQTTYTLQDFIDFHGQGKAQQLWAQAAPKPAGRGAGSRGRGQS